MTKPKPIPLHLWVEEVARFQRAHYDALLEKHRQNVELCKFLSEEEKTRSIAERKEFLDKDFDRCIAESAEIVAGIQREGPRYMERFRPLPFPSNVDH